MTSKPACARSLPNGLYFLVRDLAQQTALETALTQADPWQRPLGCPEQLALFQLIEGQTGEAARQISCFQEIASEGCFSLGMIAEYEEPLQQYGPWFYPRLFWEAGVIGQVLYLEAEAAGVRSTGIGSCRTRGPAGQSGFHQSNSWIR